MDEVVLAMQSNILGGVGVGGLDGFGGRNGEACCLLIVPVLVR